MRYEAIWLHFCYHLFKQHDCRCQMWFHCENTVSNIFLVFCFNHKTVQVKQFNYHLVAKQNIFTTHVYTVSLYDCVLCCQDFDSTSLFLWPLTLIVTQGFLWYKAVKPMCLDIVFWESCTSERCYQKWQSNKIQWNFAFFRGRHVIEGYHIPRSSFLHQLKSFVGPDRIQTVQIYKCPKWAKNRFWCQEDWHLSKLKALFFRYLPRWTGRHLSC